MDGALVPVLEGNRRSFDCAGHDEAVICFAQDDTIKN